MWVLLIFVSNIIKEGDNMDNNILEIGYDTTFEMNEFNEPRIRSDIETVKNSILFILFAKPGQYPSLPDIGLDIQSLLYSHYDELDTEKLKEDIIDQCKALKYYFRDGSVDIKKIMYRKKSSLLIHIEGTASYPDGYMKDNMSDVNRYLIGISFDEMDKMICNINTE